MYKIIDFVMFLADISQLLGFFAVTLWHILIFLSFVLCIVQIY